MLRPGGRRRTTVFGLFVVIVYLGPIYVLELVSLLVRSVPGFGWVPLVVQVLEPLLCFAYYCAVMTVASIDYRLRAEGTDLHAAIEAPVPA
jgi:hypothetical protein